MKLWAKVAITVGGLTAGLVALALAERRERAAEARRRLAAFGRRAVLREGVTMNRLMIALAAGIAGIACTNERIVYRDAPTGPSPVSEATPAPPPSFRFPQGIPERDILVIPGVPTLHNEVNAVMAEMFPNCQIGQERCNGLGYSPEAFYRTLADKLRQRGLWAGMDIEWIRDEITVSRTCEGPWENFHAWYYGGYPIWAKPDSTPCAGSGSGGGCKYTSYRGNTLIPASYCAAR